MVCAVIASPVGAVDAVGAGEVWAGAVCAVAVAPDAAGLAACGVIGARPGAVCATAGIAIIAAPAMRTCLNIIYSIVDPTRFLLNYVPVVALENLLQINGRTRMRFRV